MSAALNAAAASAVIVGLIEAGVTRVFASPGGRSTPLYLAASASALEVRTILDERAAGFLALGAARASGAPVALLCTSGSAASHYQPAVIEAAEARLPLVILSADRPHGALALGAPQTVPQRLSGLRAHVDAPTPREGVPARIWRRLAHQAVLAAREGPAQLNLPFDEPLWAEGITYAVAAAPQDWTAEGLAARIAGREGVIYCGADAPEPEILCAIGARLGWPVLAEAASGARFGPHGAATISAYHGLCRGAPAPEIVLHAGRATHSRAVSTWARGAAQVLIEPHGRAYDPEARAEALYPITPSALLSALEGHEAAEGRVARWWRTAQAEAEALNASICGDGLWGGAVARALAASLPAGGRLHVANSMAFRLIDALAAPRSAPLRVYTHRGANGIEGGLAAATGEALVAGPTHLLIGDLSALHDMSALISVADLRPDLTVVLLDNRGGGIFEHLPLPKADRAYTEGFRAAQPLDFEGLWVAAGLPSTRVETLEGLHRALHAAHEGGPRLITIPLDPARDAEAFRAAHKALLRAPLEGDQGRDLKKEPA